MPDSRKIDGAQSKDGEQIALDGDNEFRNSRLSLSKEKTSPDGAHEKLLHKEDEVKIVRDMRVDMVDAKYVSGDHRNGDPKIELDANKKQFSGLTKEELMKYADDPFWVRLRWFMFVLFWALWVAMLAAAIFIIVKAPSCPASAPRTWFEKGPLVELELGSGEYSDVESHLPLLKTSKVQGIFLKVPTYEALDNAVALEKFKSFALKAKEYSIKVIVDVTPNFVSIDHPWFKLSENNTAPYDEYFKWAPPKYEAGNRTEPNSWVSVYNTSAWSYRASRDAYYLHQYQASQPDLDFNNPAVAALFTDALTKWMQAGAGGVRLNKARLMVVNPLLPKEPEARGQGSNPGAGHTDYDYYWHNETSDQPALLDLFRKFKDATEGASTLDTEKEKPVFTLKEEKVPELYLLKEQLLLQPNSSAPLSTVDANTVAYINSRLKPAGLKGQWPILQLKMADPDVAKELALFSVLLPATPVFDLNQLVNDSSTHSLSHLLFLRSDESIQHGAFVLTTVPGRLDVPISEAASEATSEATGGAAGGATSEATGGTLLACARYKSGHTGYIAVYNPWHVSLRAALGAVRSVPAALTVHHVSAALVRNNYTTTTKESADNVLVPAKSTVVLSYVPLTTVEN